MEPKYAICVGKFEALHLGHAHLINSTIEYAKNNGLAAAVMSFTNPSPVQFLSDPGYKPLLSFREQAFLLDGWVSRWIPYPFDDRLAKMGPEEFCHLLQEKYSCEALIVGENFRFGRNRQGNANSLRELGMKVVEVPHIELEGEKISTSQIRSNLVEGRLEEANRLLGRPFIVVGKVEKGRQLGRTIGFPTANVHPAEDKLLPVDGVYASRIIIPSMGVEKAGITNVGINPTVTGDGFRKVESFIFDFDGDIYGDEIVVQLCYFIRAEQSFNGIDELKAQIGANVEEAKRLLSN